MQSDAISRTHSKCPACGKKVIVRDKRDKSPQYCSRICSANMRYRTRYQGTSAGPADRPKNWNDKKKFKKSRGGDR